MCSFSFSYARLSFAWPVIAAKAGIQDFGLGLLAYWLCFAQLAHSHEAAKTRTCTSTFDIPCSILDIPTLFASLLPFCLSTFYFLLYFLPSVSFVRCFAIAVPSTLYAVSYVLYDNTNGCFAGDILKNKALNHGLLREHGAAFGRNQTVSSHPFAALTQETKTLGKNNLYQQIFVFLVSLCETV